jgi:hypothetical protein
LTVAGAAVAAGAGAWAKAAVANNDAIRVAITFFMNVFLKLGVN